MKVQQPQIGPNRSVLVMKSNRLEWPKKDW